MRGKLTFLLFKFPLLMGAALFLVCLTCWGQMHSSASIMEVVNPVAVAAVVSPKVSANPATVGTLITYTVTVTGSNGGQSPAGTVTVVGLTGTQTAALVNGTATCSETPAAVTPAGGTKVTFTFNSSTQYFF